MAQQNVPLTQKQVHILIALCEARLEEAADRSQDAVCVEIDALLEVLDEASARFRG